MIFESDSYVSMSACLLDERWFLFGLFVAFAFFIVLLECTVYNFYTLDHIVHCDLVFSLVFWDRSWADECFLWKGAGLVLDKVQRIHHELDCCFSMDANCEHANDARSEAVVETEG